MAKVKAFQDADGVPYAYRFTCPGCGDEHILHTGKPNTLGASWSFNNDVDKPTFQPSLNYRTGHYCPGSPPAEACWLCKEAREDNHPSLCLVCHSFIRDGKIQFLGDCTHAFAGQTLELPEIEE
jgi:hypothetical protein